CHPGGCVDIPIADKYRIRINPGPRILQGEKLAPFPVGCRLAAVEQAGSSQEQRAGADGADTPNTSGHLSDPLHHLQVYLVILDRTPTGDEQGVDLAAHPPKRVMSRDA